jgi:hypothetical protein
VIEPDLTKSDFPHIHFEEAREKMLNQYGKKGWGLLRLIHTQTTVLNIFSKENIFKRDLK